MIKCWKENIAGENRGEGGFADLNMIVRDDNYLKLSEKVPWVKWGSETCKDSGKDILGRGKIKCNGLEMRKQLAHLRNSKLEYSEDSSYREGA